MTRGNSLKHQVLWRRLSGLVEEQAQSIMHTSFCTIVRESGDLSAALFDLQGRMLVQAETGTPGFIWTIAEVAKAFLEVFPVAKMRRGDAYITNDPWLACGHLHDMVVISPVFVGDRPVALIVSSSHVVDVGGRGLTPDATQIFEEGLCIPPSLLLRDGKANDTLLTLLRVNVRDPLKVEGDIFALATANEGSARRIEALFADFGVGSLAALADEIITSSSRGMRDAIRGLPEGTYRHRIKIDGYDKPIELVAAMTIESGSISVDFSGTSPAIAFGLNVPLNYSRSYAWFGIKAVVAPALPANFGTLSPIQIDAPLGCVINPPRPWPVAARHIIGHLLPDLMIGCLSQAVPDRCPAESAASLWGPQFEGGGTIALSLGETADSVGPGFTTITVNAGGCGARPGLDGLSATAFPTNLRNVPVEVIEATSPLRIWRRELRPNSGGPGEFRGGLGQTIEIGAADDAPFVVHAMFERIDYPAKGRNGGAAGAPGRVHLAAGRTLSGKGRQVIPRGEHLVLETPGGAGLGDPRKRAEEHVRSDVIAGLVSPDTARDDYGWREETARRSKTGRNEE
jgi:N-methylhydantoinase B